jgi:5-methylcytosine-specific restriction endonuclease McrA
MPLDVQPAQFVSAAHYGAWMRGQPMRAAGKRRGIPARYRAIVFRHYGHRCHECGATADIQVEHVVPVVFGGSNQPGNMVPLCGVHNRARWTPAFRALLEQADAA